MRPFQQVKPAHTSVTRAVNKTTRGAKTADAKAPHLLAAVTHTGVVLAQCQVADKSNELPAFIPLLSPLDLTGVVITSDAMQTQRANARFPREDKNAHFIFPVLDNQPTLFDRLDTLTWKNVPVVARTDDHDRGRHEVRTIPGRRRPRRPELPPHRAGLPYRTHRH